MNKLKKFLAGIMALTCMLSATSCSPQEDTNGNKANNSALVQEMAKKSYKAIELDADLPFEEAQQIIPIGDTGKLLVSGYSMVEEQYTQESYITDYEFLTFTKLDLGLEETSSLTHNARFVAANNGNIYAIVTTTDYGDFELPDYNDPDFDYENFDYEAMEEAATTTHSIYTLDDTGNVLTTNEIKGLEKYGDDEFNGGQVYISECFALGDDSICISVNGAEDMLYITVDSVGNLSEPLDFGDDKYFYPYGTDRDNNFVFVSQEGTKNVLKTLDASTRTVSPDVVNIDDSASYFNVIIKGTNEYRVYLSSSTSLYGLTDDGTLEELVNWIDSDMTGDYIGSILSVGDGDLIVTENDWSNGSTNIYRLTKRDASEIENVQIINMVMDWSDTEIIERVKDFNKLDNGYRIKVEDYSQYFVWDEEAEKQTNSPDKQLKQDLAAGKDVDIICMSDSSSIFSNLSRKGALVDFYEMLEKDEELSKEDFVPTILSACEKDGKLTTLSPTFYISTLACKSKYFDKENWTVDEFIETCRNLPEGMKPFAGGSSNMDIFGHFIYNSGDFIDYNNATCDFNNPDFIKILEFCSEYPNAGEGGEIDWENATDDEMNSYWEETEVAIRNDKALLSEIYLDDPRAYARALQAEFGEDITIVGYPSADGHGAQISTSNAFAIMENSDYKDACWDFIKEAFSEENQSSEYSYGLPVLKSAFEKKLDESMEKPYYIDQDGKKQEYEDTWYIGGEEITIDPLTQAERDFIEEYITNAKPSTFYYNEDVFNIIQEEVEAYFAGKKTAEQTAEIIQNRVSILISEQS